MTAQTPAGGQKNNPQHGITLETMLNDLVAYYGWKELARRIPIQCFYNEPSIKSSLKFLRRTPWARAQVEALDLALRSQDDGRA
ncbi:MULTISPECIES: VF530 family protein [Chitinibacter]|uniref:VF530 family protein n=1 Tax=Chitinibacter TaxID=230666 RepID=UPI00040D2525|nr:MULTISPECIES: VF530 family protein [Chitinibacter]